jgi:uncharacterized protein YcgI (DUF1989 family)
VHPRYVLDGEFYDGVRSAEHQLRDEFVISPASARAFIVEKGQVFRVKQATGSQVGEVAFWNVHDPKESFAAMRNRLFDIVVFQKVCFDTDDGKWYVAPNDSKVGDYVEFYAEIDLLVAVSVCPYGDNARNVPEDESLRPLGIEMYETGVIPRAFPRWTDWRPEWTGKWVPPQGASV